VNSEIRTRSDTGNEGPVNPAEDHSAWWASLKSGLLIAPLILTSRRRNMLPDAPSIPPDVDDLPSCTRAPLPSPAY